jgi:hypothetical protein
MAEAAQDLLHALSPEQRSALSFPVNDDATRRDWGYFPRRFHGLRLGAMDHKQQKLAHFLVSTGLSLQAYARVGVIISLDNVLDLLEDRSRPEVRDPARYFLSIYGDPAEPHWAWQFEGHHVSINVTIVDGQVVSATPLFLGSNPAEVGHGSFPVVRVMGEEQDAALELFGSLNDDQRTTALIAPQAPPDFVLMNAPRVPETMVPGSVEGPAVTMAMFQDYPSEDAERVRFDINRPAGIFTSQLQPAQQERFRTLLDVYLDRLPPALAALERARHTATSSEIAFAWAGEAAPRRPHYYRIQGPNLLIEYDNTQDDANHIHAVWRDPANDFGEDALRTHLAGHH